MRNPFTMSCAVRTRSLVDLNDLFGLGVNAIDQGRRVALRAYLFHLGLGRGVVRALVADRIGQIVGQPLRRIVGDAHAIDAAHVTSRAGGHEHVARGEGFWRRIEIEQVLLRLKHYAMLRFLVDFDLRMVGTHVALRAGAGQAGNANRTGVARMAGRAVANCAVGVWFAHAVALLAAAGHRRCALRLHKGMWRAPSASRLVGFRKIHLLRRKSLLAVNRGPCGSCMAAVQKLLIDALVAAAAISRGKFGRRSRIRGGLLILAGCGLVAIEAIHPFARVQAHFIFVHHGVLHTRMAFRALAGGAHQVGGRLLGLYLWPRTIDQNADRMSAKAITTAMKTDRKDIAAPTRVQSIRCDSNESSCVL